MNSKFEFGESTGKLGLKMTNRTHTNERKMVQLYYLVPGCVVCMFKFIYSSGNPKTQKSETGIRNRNLEPEPGMRNLESTNQRKQVL